MAVLVKMISLQRIARTVEHTSTMSMEVTAKIFII